jgi:hypothetical protein
LGTKTVFIDYDIRSVVTASQNNQRRECHLRTVLYAGLLSFKTMALRSSESVFNFNTLTTIHLCIVKAVIYNNIPGRQSYVRLFSLGDARLSLVNVVTVWFISLYIIYIYIYIYIYKKDVFPMPGLSKVQ